MFSFIIRVILLALLPAIGWMILTQQVNLEGFALGYGIGLILAVSFLRRRSPRFDAFRLPFQFVAALIYLLILLWDIFVSAIDVFLRVFGIRPINPGIVRMEIGDSRSLIAGLSAHGITITPGQLVVDFDEQNHILYVHCLDIDDADNILRNQQERRLKLLKRIVG